MGSRHAQTQSCRGPAGLTGRQRAVEGEALQQATPVGAWAAYFGMLGMTMLNPWTVIYFAALALGGSGVEGVGERILFVVAAFVASASWQLLLAGGDALLGRLLTGARGRLVTALASAAVIVVPAVRIVA